MLTFTKRCTIVLAIALSVACTENTPAEKATKAEQPPIEALLSEIDTFNNQCREGSGDNPKAQAACDRLDAKMEDALKRGWCWGPQNASGADRHWMRCADDKTVGQTQEPAVPHALFEQIREWGGKCKEAWESKTDPCATFADKIAEARDQGWCWGPFEIPGSDPRWVRCNGYSKQPQKIDAKPIPPDKEIVTIATLKKMTEIGMEAFKPYRVSAMINALDLGTDGLCEHLRHDGYCANGIERVYVNINLANSAERSQLYDLRGKTGAAICATVVMHPRNVNGTMNLVGFNPGHCQ